MPEEVEVDVDVAAWVVETADAVDVDVTTADTTVDSDVDATLVVTVEPATCDETLDDVDEAHRAAARDNHLTSAARRDRRDDQCCS